MSFRKSGLVLGCLAMLFFLFSVVTPHLAKAGVKSEVEPWVWTKENPKPSWWTWGDDYEKAKPVRGGYYRSAATRYIGLMNPNHWPVNDWVAMTQLYEMLIYNDGNYRASIPWLAKSFKFESPTSVVMKLRKGVQFHDGTYFDAETLKYQIDWIRNKRNGCWSRAWLKPVKKIEVVDDFTVRWTFKKPWAAFPGIMANVPGYVMSRKALEEGGPKAMDNHAVGTGRFMFEEGRPGNYLKLKRNPNWWFGKSIGHPEMPYFDGWLINVIPDPSVQLANLRAGKIDGMTVDPSQYLLIKDSPNLKVYKVNQNHVTAMRFNTQKGPCKDIRVRKAISHAIDRKALIEGTVFGLGRIASCMYPGDHWCHNPNLKPVSYDPELSRKLLAEAGYPNGLTVKGYYANYAIAMNIAEAIKAMLKQVGVNWEVEFLDSAASSDRMKNLEYDFAGGGWVWIWDPDLMATGLYMPEGGFNYGRSNLPAAQKLIRQGRAEVDLKKRQKIYWQLEKMLYDDYEDAWLWWSVSVSAYRKNVMGWNTKLYLKGREGFWFSHPMWFKNGKP